MNPDNCLTIPHTVDCLQVTTILKTLLGFFAIDPSPVFQGILSVIPLQMLSYHMAVMRWVSLNKLLHVACSGDAMWTVQGTWQNPLLWSEESSCILVLLLLYNLALFQCYIHVTTGY